MTRKRLTKTNQIVIGLLLIVLSVLLGVIFFYSQATAPYTQAKNEAIALAQAKTNVKTVTHFDITTTTTTTYSLIGKDVKGQALGVLLPAKGGEIKVVKLSDNQSDWTEKTAKLTLYKGQVVWQTKDLSLYGFETGQKIDKTS